jgi:hypothetical protein
MYANNDAWFNPLCSLDKVREKFGPDVSEDIILSEEARLRSPDSDISANGM